MRSSFGLCVCLFALSGCFQIPSSTPGPGAADMQGEDANPGDGGSDIAVPDVAADSEPPGDGGPDSGDPADAADLDAADGPDGGGSTYRATLTILGTSITGTSSGLPVPLVMNSDADLQAVSERGSQVWFTTVDGEVLPSERVLYDHQRGTLRAWIEWTDLLEGQDSSIHLWVGPDGLNERAWQGYSGVWHLEEQNARFLRDASVHDAQATGTGLSGADFIVGQVGQALNFDGTKYITVPNHAALEPAQFTIMMWVKQVDQYSTKNLIAKPYTYSAGSPNWHSYQLMTARGDNVGDTSGPLMATIYSQGQSSYWTFPSDTLLPVDTWAHVAFTFDGGQVQLYIDGVLVRNQGSGGAVDYDGHDLLIGATDDGNNIDDMFVGGLDEVTIEPVHRDGTWVEMSRRAASLSDFVQVGAFELITP